MSRNGPGLPRVKDDDRELSRSTRAHYEAYPFVSGGQVRVQRWRRRLSSMLPSDIVEGKAILDVGCGSGEVALSVSRRGGRVCCVDLTQAAVVATKQLDSTLVVAQADALALPFLDKSFDHTMSIGVLHHSPDCKRGLGEMARVTRPGGRAVVLLYSRWTPYHLIYRATGLIRNRFPVDSVERLPRWVLRVARLVVGVQIHQLLADDQLKRIIADQYWTPRATFHTARQVRRWGAEAGLRLLQRRVNLLYSSYYVFEKPR